MTDDLFTASLVVVLAFAAYPLFLCIWNAMGAYNDHFVRSEWKLDPGKPFSLGRFKIPVLSALTLVGYPAFAVVLAKTLLLMGLRPG